MQHAGIHTLLVMSRQLFVCRY